MLLNLAFTLLAIVTCGFALTYGGWEGRRICTMFLISGALSAFTPFADPNGILANFLIDFTLLVGLIDTAIRTDRYWPMWICGLHLISTLSYLAWATGDASYWQLKAVASFWSIPELLLLGLGPWLDQKGGRHDALLDGFGKP